MLVRGRIGRALRAEERPPTSARSRQRPHAYLDASRALNARGYVTRARARMRARIWRKSVAVNGARVHAPARTRARARAG